MLVPEPGPGQIVAIRNGSLGTMDRTAVGPGDLVFVDYSWESESPREGYLLIRFAVIVRVLSNDGELVLDVRPELRTLADSAADLARELKMTIDGNE